MAVREWVEDRSHLLPPNVRRLLSYVLWPALFAGSLTIIYAGIQGDYAVVTFNLTYLGLALVLACIERIMPHERAWLADDGQMGPDLAHTLFNKGLAQGVITLAAYSSAAEFAAKDGVLWPNDWPLGLQTILGLFIVEIGLYWKHRLAHEWLPLWRFHAVHHSATRLWFFNTGRFHIVDTATGLMVGMPALLLLGADQDTMLFVGAITAVIGILSHCNIEVRCGMLSYVFNTPTLHRWHHSKIVREGNTNYGENLMLFDILFGTFYNPARRPPVAIGIHDPMPSTFWGQLRAPFRRAAL